MNNTEEPEAPELFQENPPVRNDAPIPPTSFTDVPAPMENDAAASNEGAAELTAALLASAAGNFAVQDASIPINADSIPEVPPAPLRKLPPNLGFGATLRVLREEAHLSTAEVAEQTKLRESYISAMESENFDALPQLVFVLAYAKKLGTLYKVDPVELEQLLNVLRDKVSFDVPEDINKSVVDRELDEENASRVRRIVTIFVLGVIFVLFLLGTVLTLLFTGLSRGTEPAVLSSQDDSVLVELQEKPQLKTTELTL